MFLNIFHGNKEQSPFHILDLFCTFTRLTYEKLECKIILSSYVAQSNSLYSSELSFLFLQNNRNKTGTATKGTNRHRLYIK